MATSPSMPIEALTPQAAGKSRSVEGRYLDAYRAANFYAGLGGTIKKVSLVVGGIIVLLSLMMLSSGGLLVGVGFFGILAGAVAAGVGWVLGTLIAAQGQMLRATLDSAVHTSPFIDDSVRARIMSL